MDEILSDQILGSKKISGISGAHILPFLCVALVWGSTDVLIARASIQQGNEFQPRDFSPLNLIKLIWKKKIWIWMGINQIGSVLYAYLLGVYPEEYSLIWANSLTVLVAFILDKALLKFSHAKNAKGQAQGQTQGQTQEQDEKNNIQQKDEKIERLDHQKGWYWSEQIQNWVGIGLILLGIYLMLI